MKRLRSLSIFFPCLNDSKILPYLIARTYLAAAKVTDDFEVIIINDGSTDDSAEILESLKKRYRHLSVVHHPRNLGYGQALISGFTKAKKDWIFYTDGDGQYDPTDLILLVRSLKKGIDVVNGYKLARSDWLGRKLLGGMYNYVLHRLYDLPISDVDCDFRLIRSSKLKKINLNSTSGVICLELIIKLRQTGAKFAEVGVAHYPRAYGRSQFFNVKSISQTLYDNVIFYSENFLITCQGS